MKRTVGLDTGGFNQVRLKPREENQHELLFS